MSNIPKLRFPEFTDAWEKCKFKNFFNKSISNNTLSRTELTLKEGMIHNIHYGDILIKYGSIVDLNNDKDIIPYISNAREEDYVDKFLRNGDIVIADTAEDNSVGKAIEIINLDNKPIVAGLHTMAFRSQTRIAPYFMGYYLNSNSYRSQLRKLFQGIKVLSISKSNISETFISYPRNKSEQQKIGNLFKQLDRLITLHKRKWDDVILLKKALLQKMFPKNGSDFPEIRFPEFTDAWEKCKLGEILIENLKPVDKPQNGYTRLGLRSHMKGTFHEEVEAGKGLDVDTMYEVEENNLILNITFAWEMAIAITNSFDKGKLVSHRFPQYKFSQGYSPDFFYYSIDNKKFKENLLLASPGGAGRNRVLKKSEFLKIEKKFPKSLDEQQKIGNLFKQLDRLVTLHKRQHEHYQLLKKALLQQMFV